MWNGSSWSAVSSSGSQISNGRVSAIAVAAGKVYAGGNFTNAGNDADADFLAVWDGASWKPFCVPPGQPLGGNVTSLQIIGQTLYVGGTFQNGAGIASADYLLACGLPSGTPSTTVADVLHPFSGSVYALAADSNGTLYAGGGFANLENIDAADNVASLPAGGALGADSGGGNGWFSTPTEINALVGTSTHVFVTGTFLNANGDARADNVAFFDGSAWHPVGFDGLRNGPWSGNGLALALVDRQLYAAGSFTSAGGDPQAHSVASFALTQIIAYPTPTVTAGPGPIATPTVTASPPPAPTPTVTPTPDAKPPATSLRRAQIAQSARTSSSPARMCSA